MGFDDESLKHNTCVSMLMTSRSFHFKWQVGSLPADVFQSVLHLIIHDHAASSFLQLAQASSLTLPCPPHGFSILSFFLACSSVQVKYFSMCSCNTLPSREP